MPTLLVHPPELLARAMAQRAPGLVVAHQPGQWAGDQDTPPDVRFELFPWRHKLHPLAIATMHRLLTAHRPALVHAFSPRGLAAAVLATSWIRNPPPILSFRGIATPPKRLDPANQITYLSRRVRGHACESEAVMRGLIAAGISAEKCRVVYNGVEPSCLNVQKRETVRQQFGIPNNAFVVGTVANARPVKQIDVLLRAAHACLDLDDLYVLLIGDIRDRKAAQLVRGGSWQGRLRLPGFVPLAGGLTPAFDLFVMPSRSEGLCRALLEAMSQNRCPIVSDGGGMKEIVRHRKEGLVVPSGDADALVASIRMLHRDRSLLAALGNAAGRRVQERFQPDHLADRILQMHRDYATVEQPAARLTQAADAPARQVA